MACIDCQDSLAPLTGPAGPIGLTGPAAADGNDGADGADGANGTTLLENNRTAVPTPNAVSEEDLMTYVMPAATLAANGDEIEIEAYWSCTANTATKDPALYFGAITLLGIGSSTLNTSSIKGFVTRWRITRKTATAIQTEIKNSVIGPFFYVASETYQMGATSTVVVADLTANSFSIRMTGFSNGGAAGDLVARYLRVTKYSV